MNAAANTTPARRKRLGFGKVLWASMGLGVLAGGVAALFGELGLVPQPPAYAAAVLLAGVGGLWFSYKWWSDVDEAVRAAHTTSWFWGGSCGLLVVGAVTLGLFGITQGDLPEQYGVTRQEAGMILTGIVFTVVTMLIGYGLWWAGWWISRSR